MLLDAIDRLPKSFRKKISLDINGSGLERQPANLQKKIQIRLAELKDVVTFRGAYTQSELPALMQTAHWMIMPSRWWENSPVVILEAAKYGVPVICSNIGGMAEKIIDGKTGIHFKARRTDSLVDALIWAINNPDKRNEFTDNIRESYQHDVAYLQHAQLYHVINNGQCGKESTPEYQSSNASTVASMLRAA